MEDYGYSYEYDKGTGSFSSDVNWGAVGNFFGNLINKGADVWAQTTLMEQNIDGQRYIEGQRAAAQQQAYQMQMQQQGGSTGLLMMLAIGAVVFLVATK